MMASMMKQMYLLLILMFYLPSVVTQQGYIESDRWSKEVDNNNNNNNVVVQENNNKRTAEIVSCSG
jgi:hypothetical protein